MTFRTEGDIVLAASMAQDLTNLVVAYLELYKKYAQGLNDVNVPDGPYTVVFRRIKEKGMLRVKLVHTVSTSWEEPTYYDDDSDYFDESWGASNVSGYTVRQESHIEEADLSIPISALLLTREQMEQDVRSFADRKNAELRERERQRQIAEHEAAIQALKAGRGASPEASHDTQGTQGEKNV